MSCIKVINKTSLIYAKSMMDFLCECITHKIKAKDEIMNILIPILFNFALKDSNANTNI